MLAPIRCWQVSFTLPVVEGDPAPAKDAYDVRILEGQDVRPQPLIAHSAPRVAVGVGVIVLRAGHVLLGQRMGSHGAGTWALPGGHLEFGESVEHCAIREVREETGLALQAVSRGPYTSDLFAADGTHYVTLFVVAHSGSGEPRVLEPTQCAGWQWFRWSEFPAPLFQPLATLLRTGFVPQNAT